MICTDCFTAGALNHEANQTTVGRALLQDRARILHSYCEGKCDCQHRLGKWITDGKGPK